MLCVRNLHRLGLQPASFDVGPGECVVVRGSSGAGKSLLLRAIADLDANEGEVALFGAPRAGFSGPEWRRKVGYLPAEPGWWADRVGAHFSDWNKTYPLAERLGLPKDAADWPLTRPSTGERQRLALVRALAIGPSVLMLDEPTAALDHDTVSAVEALIKDKLAEGLMVLWVSHDPQQGDRLGGRVLWMEQGRLSEAKP